MKTLSTLLAVLSVVLVLANAETQQKDSSQKTAGTPQEIKSIRIVVEDTYKGVDKFALPFFDYARRILDYTDIIYLPIVPDMIYDAVLHIRSNGRVYISGDPEIHMEGLYHSKVATIEGDLSIRVAYRALYNVPLTGKYREPVTVRIIDGKAYTQPAESLLRIAFDQAFPASMFHILQYIIPNTSNFVNLSIRALSDKDSAIRRAAGETLVKIGIPSVEPLITALKGEDLYVRGVIADLLRRITGQNFGKEQAKWQEWWLKNKSN